MMPGSGSSPPRPKGRVSDQDGGSLPVRPRFPRPRDGSFAPIANDERKTSCGEVEAASEGGCGVMGTIRVVLAEDHALMRDAVGLVFGQAEDVELVGEVANGQELLPLLARVEADFVLLDVQLPGLDGLGCLEALAEHYPQLKVAMLSAVEDPQVIESAFRRGARGYILKSVNPFDLPAAIRQIVDESVIHRPLAGRSDAGAPAQGVLSAKEVAVLVELCHGHSNREIAATLWLSEQTVKFHLRNIYRKLGIKSRTEALRYAYEHDLVPTVSAPAA
jgi:DNA-binding NarL/FixJ family response regulator